VLRWLIVHIDVHISDSSWWWWFFWYVCLGVLATYITPNWRQYITWVLQPAWELLWKVPCCQAHRLGLHIFGLVHCKLFVCRSWVVLWVACRLYTHIFICSFKHMRNLDRLAHMETYPELAFPNMFLLKGGYKAFFELYSVSHLQILCTNLTPWSVMVQLFCFCLQQFCLNW
jgi:hypothetical protein